jgi:predicted metal-binding protein
MSPRTTVYVCTSCRRKTGDGEGDFDQPGRALAERLSGALEGEAGIDVMTVECLSVCKRPCTVALAAEGKWTYVVGDLDGEAHVCDIVSAVRAFSDSADGVVPWRERPQTFRKGVIARVPPLGLADGKTVAPAVLTKVNGT